MKFVMKCLLSLPARAGLLVVSPWAFARGSETPVGQGLQYLLDALLGTDGIILATLSIIGVGLLCLGHFLEWKRLLQTIVGIAIMFGSSGIVSSIVSLVQ